LERKNRAARSETAEEVEARERWLARMRNLPEPDPVDPEIVARFQVALEEYQVEKTQLDAREERLRRIRAAAVRDVAGFSRPAESIPAEYLPRGDAYEGPDEDIPPPPEVS